MYADDGSTASKQNLTMMFDGVDVNMALPGGAIVDGGSVSTYDNGRYRHTDRANHALDGGHD